MIDAEVIRLRRLRRVALLTRRLARAFHMCFPNDGVFARAAVSAWSVARLMNGRLRSHPNLDYQQAQGPLQTTLDQALAALTGWVAMKQGRPQVVLAQQLQILTRELDDARALTWSADLSDALGRAQWQLLRLQHDLGAGVRREGAAPVIARTEATGSTQPASSDWPYLAI
jgi:hypothetical protein